MTRPDRCEGIDLRDRDYGERTRRWAAQFQSESEYADPALYFGRRLRLLQTWGPLAKPGDSVLQIGCGDGYMARLLLDCGYPVMACDHAPELLDKTIARSAEYAKSGQLQVCRIDINSLPIPLDGSYQHTFAVMRSLFHYAKRPEETLRELRRLTETKLILDFDPREVSQKDVLDAVSAVGFTKARVRAFLVPQKRSLFKVTQALLCSIETTPWLYGPLVKRKFHVWVTAS